MLVDLVIMISIIDNNDIINSKMLKLFFLKRSNPSPINFKKYSKAKKTVKDRFRVSKKKKEDYLHIKNIFSKNKI